MSDRMELIGKWQDALREIQELRAELEDLKARLVDEESLVDMWQAEWEEQSRRLADLESAHVRVTGEREQALRGLLEIAEEELPDGCFRTDSRVTAAREALGAQRQEGAA
jgi:seryl-tRNA synthetase